MGFAEASNQDGASYEIDFDLQICPMIGNSPFIKDCHRVKVFKEEPNFFETMHNVKYFVSKREILPRYKPIICEYHM